MYGFGGDSWRAPLRKRRNAQAVPYEHPAGMRIWKCRITAASVPGIEIASATPAAVFHGTLFANGAKHRLPAVYQARFWVVAGGLMSYGADRVERLWWPRTASLAGLLLFPASAPWPPRGLGGGGAMLRRHD
jgi:hypothetical protein